VKTETTSYFEVQYQFYQYNSGACDNGYYTRSTSFKTAEEAIELAARIEKQARHHRYKDIPSSEPDYDPETYTDEDREDLYGLERELMGYSGFFTWAKAYETEVKRTPLPIKQRETAPMIDTTVSP